MQVRVQEEAAGIVRIAGAASGITVYHCTTGDLQGGRDTGRSAGKPNLQRFYPTDDLISDRKSGCSGRAWGIK